MYLQHNLPQPVAGMPLLRWWAGVSAKLWQRCAAARRLRPAPTLHSDAEGMFVAGSSGTTFGAVQVLVAERGIWAGTRGKGEVGLSA